MTMTNKTQIKATYIGDGNEGHHGIPARNLTNEDWAALNKDQQRIVSRSRLYKMAESRDEIAKKLSNAKQVKKEN